MISRTPECIASITDELKLHPNLSGLSELTCEIQEYSYNPNSLHFAATEASTSRPVIIKVGVDERELYWTTQLARVDPGLVPEIVAWGRLTNGGFLASEKIRYGPLGPRWQGHEFDLLLGAAARFYKATRQVEPLHLKVRSFAEILEWLEQGCSQGPPGDWQAVLDHVKEDYAWLVSVCPPEVCHGDLHLGNAMSRSPAPGGPALLIDIHPASDVWVFEAAYLEILTCGDQSRKGVGNMIPRLNRFRDDAGLPALLPATVDRASIIALAWYALKMWDPETFASPDYERMVKRYIDAGAAISR